MTLICGSSPPEPPRGESFEPTIRLKTSLNMFCWEILVGSTQNHDHLMARCSKRKAFSLSLSWVTTASLSLVKSIFLKYPTIMYISPLLVDIWSFSHKHWELPENIFIHFAGKSQNESRFLVSKGATKQRSKTNKKDTWRGQIQYVALIS